MCIIFILAMGKPRQSSSLSERAGTLELRPGCWSRVCLGFFFFQFFSEQGGRRRMGKKVGWKIRVTPTFFLTKMKNGKTEFPSVLNGRTQCAAFQWSARKAKERWVSFTPPLRGKLGCCRSDMGGCWGNLISCNALKPLLAQMHRTLPPRMLCCVRVCT